MPFIVYPNNSNTGGTGGTGGTSDVLSVNGKKGNVFLSYRDVGAIANVLSSCGGIQVGTLSNRPTSANSNVLYVTTDTLPNEFYRFNSDTGNWEQIGSSKVEEKEIIAVEVMYNNTGTGLVSTNLQDVVMELNNLIKDKEVEVKKLIDINKGKVQLDSNDDLGYLNSKIDNYTLVIENGKIVVKSIVGLETTIEELNYSKGLKENIQKQIDSLSRVGNFTGAVDTKAQLDGLTNLTTNDMVIVINDETKENVSTIYMYDGTKWIFVGEFKAEIRDFNTNPIDLASEIKGILLEKYIDSKIARKTDIKNINSTDELSEGTTNLYYTEDRVKNNAEVRANTLNRHKHNNPIILNGLSESVDGRLMYKNKIIESSGSSGTVEWTEF